MNFPVYVSLVVIGSDEQETKTGLLKIGDNFSLAGARLNQGEGSLDIISELIKTYVGDVDPNLFFVNRAGFLDDPDRYKDAEQDVVLVYRITVPLHTSLNNGMEWMSAAFCNDNRKYFLKDHFNIINMALDYGQIINRRTKTIH